ncbi:hypothetical protein AKJ16_DCAP00387 [Drosera capensis]
MTVMMAVLLSVMLQIARCSEVGGFGLRLSVEHSPIELKDHHRPMLRHHWSLSDSIWILFFADHEILGLERYILYSVLCLHTSGWCPSKADIVTSSTCVRLVLAHIHIHGSLRIEDSVCTVRKPGMCFSLVAYTSCRTRIHGSRGHDTDTYRKRSFEFR